MEELLPRKPLNEVTRKFIIGCILSLVFIIFYLVLSKIEFTPDLVTLTFFIFGGIFFIIGGVRDFLESIVYKMIRGKQVESFREPIDSNYLYGFGKAGEDVIVGFIFIMFSILSSLAG